jgi:hypothetical protein
MWLIKIKKIELRFLSLIKSEEDESNPSIKEGKNP